MPDTLNKQSLINLLIDSPLREPIKINLIDIVNNTSDPDLPKVYSTIVKELEIFQKATERRMKLAEETITKLGGTTAPTTTGIPENGNTGIQSSPVPPLDLPPLPTPSVATPPVPENGNTGTQVLPPLSVPPLDLPPMPSAAPVPETPVAPAPEPAPTPAPAPLAAVPPLAPLGAPAPSTTSDEDALAEIQKELDSLKSATATEITAAAAPAPVQQ